MLTVIILVWLTSLWAAAHLYRYCRRSRRFKQFDRLGDCRPPVTVPTPVLGGVLHKIRLMKQTYGDLFKDYYVRKFRDFGPTHSILGRGGLPKVVHSIDPANLNAILTTSWDDWRVFDTRRNSLYPLTQDAVLLTDGATWHRNRKMLYRRINSIRSKDARASELDVCNLFRAIGKSEHDGWIHDVGLYDLVRRLSLDMSTRYLFGICADYQTSGMQSTPGPMVNKEDKELVLEDKPEGWQTLVEKFSAAWKLAGRYVARRSALGSKYWLVDGVEYRRACADLKYFAHELATAALSRKSTAENSASLVELLYEELHDSSQVAEHVLEMIMAGQNMTGTVMAWVFAELGRHPEIYARLRNEVLENFGHRDASHLMTWDRLKACTLLQHVILETMRCHPTVAMISRTARRNTVLPHGGGDDGLSPLAVPEGATFSCNVFLMHRRPEEWGEDSWEWKPDRWLFRKIGPEYSPFGGGPRVCIGRQLSMTEISFVLARFAQHFEAIKATNGIDPIAHEFTGILAPKHGVRVDLRRQVDC